MFCIKCGKEIPDESNYCLYCGILLPGKNISSLIKIGEGKTLIVVNCNFVKNWKKYKINIFVDGNLEKTVNNGGNISFEIENGKHIVFCEAPGCQRSDAIEIIANSNEIYFSVAFPPITLSYDFKIIITKTKETDAGTWE
jgi:hypothetical protein